MRPSIVPDKPITLDVNVQGIPEELRAIDQWVCWRLELNAAGTKWDKVPYRASNPRSKASSTDPTTWDTFYAAVAAYKAGLFDGLMFAVAGDDPFTVLDIDECLDGEGNLSEKAAAAIRRFNTYAEVSPSGTGVHLWMVGKKPGKKCGSKSFGYELYDEKRFISVTGVYVDGVSSTIDDCQEDLNAFYAEIFPDQNTEQPADSPNVVPSPQLTDDQIIEKIRNAQNGAKFSRLWSGDTSEYDSDDSRADAAIAGMLVFYSQDDAQIVRLMRRSGLNRSKFNRDDYMEMTIKLARTGQSESFSGTIATLVTPGTSRRTNDAPSLPNVIIPRVLTPVEPMPLEYFPSRVRKYIEAAAASLGVPPDMVASQVLVAVGGIVGRSAAIETKSGKRDYAALWVSNVAMPGVGKTDSMETACSPLYLLQTEAKERYERDQEAYKRQLAEWANEGDSSPGARSDKKRGVKPEEPRLEHIWVSDYTIEALGPILDKEPGVAALVDEKSGVVTRMNQYKKGGQGSDKQQYLSLWSCSPIKVDRKKDAPILIDRPVVSIGGGFQPATIGTLFDGKQDGFSDRELVAWPDAEPLDYSDSIITEGVASNYLSLFRELYDVRKRHASETVAIPLGYEARSLYREWFNQNQRAITVGAPALQGMYAKLPRQAARIALVLHLMLHPLRPAGEVSRRTMEGAIALAEYFAAGNRRAIDYLGNTTTERSVGLPMRVYRRMEDNGEWLSLTDLHRLFGNNMPADKLRSAIDQLEIGRRISRRRHNIGDRDIDQWCVTSHTDYEARTETNSYESTPLIAAVPDESPDQSERGDNVSGLPCDEPGCLLPRHGFSHYCHEHAFGGRAA